MHRWLLALVPFAAACSQPVSMDATVADATIDVIAEDANVSPPDVAPDITDATDAAMPLRCPGPFSPPTAAELALREQMGIPDDAACAVVFGQNSHMDIDWVHTFDDYYSLFVEQILLNARTLLDADPTYRYQTCEMAYLQNHLTQHPEEIAPLAAHVARGALRIVGGGMTSPDTLLPTTEPLVRDYLRGTIFAETTLGATVNTAWLPDSFGHSPTVPDLLQGMGIGSVAFARVDGLHDAIEHLFGQAEIVPGSTAALLQSMGTADFVWVGAGGGEVLAHWMPIRIYCQGDILDNSGTPIPGGFLSSDDMSGNTDYTRARIAQFVTELAPYARTPYMFVPIGCDFQLPKPHLMDIVRDWNASQYPQTGVYAVASTFEDYAGVVNERRADLPRLTLDMADYFSGFFGSRLAVKIATRRTGDLLVQTEATALLAQTVARSPWPDTALATAWDLFERSDHHDFVTGTALDAVVSGEQLPMLAGLLTSVGGILTTALDAIGASLAQTPGAAASVAVIGTTGAPGSRTATVQLTLLSGAAHDLGAGVPSQILSSTRNPDGSLATADVLIVANDLAPLSYQRIAFHDEAPIGTVSLVDDGTTVTLSDASVSLVATIDHATGTLRTFSIGGTAWITAPSLGVESWSDQGGLYRIGAETHGCMFTPDGSDAGAVTLTALENGPARARVQIQRGTSVTVVVGVTAGTGRIDVDVTAPATMGQTNTLQIFSAASGAMATFVHAGGAVTRPPQALFSPEFWPLVRGADLVRADGSGIAIVPQTSTGLRYGSDGSIDVMVSRDATAERCDSLGAMGTEQGMPIVSLSIVPHATPIDVLAEAYAILPAPAVQISGPAAATDDEASLFTLTGNGYVLSAAKMADRGRGTVLRFERTATGMAQIGDGLVTPTTFTRTDLLERDQGATTSTVLLDAPLVTVRVE